MSMADEASSKDVLYGWEMDAAGKRLPSIYNSAKEIVACTYAYRMTSEPRYLSRVEALAISNDLSNGIPVASLTINTFL